MSSFGELLKRERELRQISLREVSEATKINLRYLEALERNDFRHLPGGVFNKGFVRAYAQYIGVDPEDMINAYLLEERNQNADAETGPQGDVLRGRRTIETAQKDDESISRGRQRIVVIVVGAIVVVAVVVLAVVWLTRGFGVRTPPDSAPVSTSTQTANEPPARTEPATDRSPDEVDDTPIDGGPVEAGTSDETLEDPPAPPEEPGAGNVKVAEPVEDLPAPQDTNRPSEPPATSPSTEAGSRDIVVVVSRPTSGRVVCDRRVEMLDGRSAGMVLRLSCASVLVVDAADGGAVRIGIDGEPPVAVGPDNQAVRGLDLLADSR